MKQLIKRMLMIWYALVHPSKGPKVVFYHDIGKDNTPMGTDEKIFWRHMELVGKENQVCFDDGFRGVWNAREAFRAHGIRPTVFVAIRLVGQPGYLTWDEIRTLQDKYGFEFQCHTWSHQTLVGEMIDESPKAERTEEWYHRELVESLEELERQLNLDGKTQHKVTAICFPVGNFSDEVIRRCQDAGYAKVYASYPGDLTDEYIQPRNIVQDCSPFDFHLVLRGGLMAFRRRYYQRHHCG